MNTTSKKTQYAYLDEDDFTSNSATKVPTQQSVKAYVETMAQGLHVLKPVQGATTASLVASAGNTSAGTLTIADNGSAAEGKYFDNGGSSSFTIDSVAITTSTSPAPPNTRILIKDGVQVGGASNHNKWNGIYTVGALDETTLTLTRAEDFDSNTEIRLGDFVFCESGTVNAGHGFVMTGSSDWSSSGNVGDVGTDQIVFTQFSGLSETVAVNQGGTGQTSYTNGQLLIGNTSGNTLAKGTITGDDGITVTNGGGSIEIDLDLKSNGGAVIESNELAIDLGASSITGVLGVTDGGTGLNSIGDNSILHTTSANTLAALTAPAADRALMYDHSSTSIKWVTLGTVCFLKGTKITLPNHEQKAIEDLKLGEQVLTYHVEGLSNLKKSQKEHIKNWSQDSMNGSFKNSKVRNIWVNPTDQYLILNDKLKLTNKHIIHVKRDNEYKFLPAEAARIGDQLLTDREHYEEIHTIEQKNETTEVYNIEVKKNKTYFAENYLVHHYCETCSGLSQRI